MRKEPVAIITSGGGTRCAYSAGAVIALGEKLGITDPDIFVAASGSVAGLFYYLTAQYDFLKEGWLKYIPTREFIRYAPFPHIDIDYFIDTLLKKRFPLDTNVLDNTPARWFVPLTDAETGEPRFVDNTYLLDPYEVMRAAKAIPILYNGHVRIGTKKYIDGDMSTSTGTLIRKAIDAGARRILCITNSPPPTRAARFALTAYAYAHPAALRETILNDIREQRHGVDWPNGLRILHVFPSSKEPAGVMTRNRRKVTESFYMGYDDLLAQREDIRKLFSETE